MDLDFEENRIVLHPAGHFQHRQMGRAVCSYSPKASRMEYNYVEGKIWFPTQIVITGERGQDAHIWLKGLSGNLGQADIQKMMDERNHMTETEVVGIWNSGISAFFATESPQSTDSVVA